MQRDIANLKEALRQHPQVKGFLPVVAPASVLQGLRDEYYGTEEKLSSALGEALRAEYKAITDAGLIVQLDDAWLAAKYDVMVPPAKFSDYYAWAEQKVEALNRALDGIPVTQSRYHVCWGSWNGPHTNDVAAEDIIDLILRVKVGGYSLEMANPRHEHEWQIWQKTKLPPDRVLLPGVIAHTTNVVEHPRLVAERLVRLAKLVGRERVIGRQIADLPRAYSIGESIPRSCGRSLKRLPRARELATAELWGRAAVADELPGVTNRIFYECSRTNSPIAFRRASASGVHGNDKFKPIQLRNCFAHREQRPGRQADAVGQRVAASGNRIEFRRSLRPST